MKAKFGKGEGFVWVPVRHWGNGVWEQNEVNWSKLVKSADQCGDLDSGWYWGRFSLNFRSWEHSSQKKAVPDAVKDCFCKTGRGEYTCEYCKTAGYYASSTVKELDFYSDFVDRLLQDEKFITCMVAKIWTAPIYPQGTSDIKVNTFDLDTINQNK